MNCILTHIDPKLIDELPPIPPRRHDEERAEHDHGENPGTGTGVVEQVVGEIAAPLARLPCPGAAEEPAPVEQETIEH